MIQSDTELLTKVAEVSAGLQEIQNYVGDSQDIRAKVRFPLGYIKTANHHRKGLWFLTPAMKRNVSYSLMSYDILKWLGNRTDLSGPAKKLLNRMGIVILGSVAEAIAVNGTRGDIGKNCQFRVRLRRMHENLKIITKTQRENLELLWDQRNTIHLGAVSDPHIFLYEVKDVNRARIAVLELIDRLGKWHFSNIS